MHVAPHISKTSGDAVAQGRARVKDVVRKKILAKAQRRSDDDGCSRSRSTSDQDGERALLILLTKEAAPTSNAVANNASRSKPVLRRWHASVAVRGQCYTSPDGESR